jgi:uncharacterized protein (TIGR02996 family)
MPEADLIRAILDDPDDDAPRLAYADWLDAGRQADRAEWIRLSCEFARVPSSDPRWSLLLSSIMESFRRCRPPWWEELSNIDQRNDRGMYRFTVGAAPSSRSTVTLKRLGKVPWLGTAVAEGWLERLEVRWCDTDLSAALAAWKAPAREVPLLVQPAPQILDEGLRRIFALPQLEGLVLATRVLRSPVIAELAACAGVRDLTLELRLLDGVTVDAILDQAVRMPRLRRLHLEGHALLDHGDRPNDGDLLRLRSLPALKRIELTNCPAVSEAAIVELRRARPELSIHRI